ANLKSIAAEEGLEIDEDALLLIAKRGDGSLRDAQSIFDQIVSLCGGTITHQQIMGALNIVDQEVYFRVTDLIKAKDAKGGLALVEELMSGGHDIKEFLGGLSEHIRNILIAKTTQSTDLIEVSDVYRKRYAEEAQRFSIPDLLRLQRFVNGTESSIRWSAQPRFRLEADMVQMVTMPAAVEVGELIQRVEELKKKLRSTQSVSQVPIVSSVPASFVAESAAARTVVPAQRPMFSKSSFVRSLPIQPPVVAVPIDSPQRPSITDGELVSRWHELIQEIRQQKIALGSVMDSAMPLGVNGGIIHIGCANEFQSSSIKRNKDLLSEIVQKVFNARARIEPEITPLTQKQAVPMKGTPQVHPPQDEHPIVKAMIRELGAEPLQ
ncbi:MAG TPA: hypothetical protein DGH68_05640, partial [Bacteroidetes bacterium]|nr:hypothetical protein [Bacteroidota bacterium]